MSFFAIRIFRIKTLVTPKSQRSGNDTKTARKKEPVVSIREGKFYCIYLVAESGQKILLNRIPVDYLKKLRKPGKPMKYDVLSSYDYNTRIALEFRQQMGIVAAHKQNVQKIMDILKEGYRDSE
ncbi:MAG: hypothetical protein ABFD18_01485 [Syntrophomonas sp.]